jgi:uncharacterized protein YndB with AHSA1/START domain
MAHDPEIAPIPDDSELARLLERDDATPLRIERNGVVYRVTRDDDVRAEYDPETIAAADGAPVGGRADLDTAARGAALQARMPVDRRALHGSFTVARGVAAPPSRNFSAFSDLSLRQRWFHIPSEPGSAHHELDFRVGGGEIAHGTFSPAGIPEHIEYRSWFLDIAADEHIMFTYELLVDGRRRSVSLVTVELVPDAGGTLMTFTEQYVFVAFMGDGRDDVREREGGMRLQLNGLIAVVEDRCTPGTSRAE